LSVRKYILFNPGAVQTKGATEAFDNKLLKILVKFIYKIIGLPVQKAVEPILHFIKSPPKDSLTAYKQKKKLDIAQVILNNNQSERLLRLTLELIKRSFIWSAIIMILLYNNVSNDGSVSYHMADIVNESARRESNADRGSSIQNGKLHPGRNQGIFTLTINSS
jgi:hypothetical protein